ncbi:MAG: OadG family protein [Cellvibrionaceae bacterium]
MENDLLAQGINLMLLGMGVVFVFLAVLIITTTVMSNIIQKYFPEVTPLNVPDLSSNSIESSEPVPSPRILSIIKAAIEDHRKAQ